MTDPYLADALFLDSHPGWGWRDLMEADEEVVELLRMIGRKRAGK